MIRFVPLLRALGAPLLLALLVPHGTPQEIPPPAVRLPDESKPVLTATLRAARTAADKGDLAAARRHYRNLLWWTPYDTDTLAALYHVTEDPTERQRIAWTLADAAIDPAGKIRLPRDLIDALPKDHDALAQARAAAVRELLRYAEKIPTSTRKVLPSNVLAAWLTTLAQELTAPSPALQDDARPILEKAVERTRIPAQPILKSLDRVLDRLFTAGQNGDAVEVARHLAGLANQAGFKDLKGPEPPDLSRQKAEANQRLAEARRRLAAELGEPLTIEQLLEMSPEEAEAFTRNHATFANPGVALSPEARYRVETSCGYETLLGVADTIEQHHQRLVNWYGTDPFLDRPGLVRIVPEFSDMEMEGVPFWWAPGFQGGDVTTMRFAVGTIEGLGHGLTHELTHRFDGAIFPGMPSWLVEGRAVWTGAAYGRTWDRNFVEGHGAFGQMERALALGYGGQRKLEELIAGTIDDYRDNYPAGYSLYLYLHTWPVEGAAPWYRDRLLQFQREVGANGRKDPVAYFTGMFADGKEGRPDGMAAFAQDFAQFLAGFYWQDRKPWTRHYAKELVGPDDPPLVYDAPTWTWSRDRAEPVFGQDGAARAGDLLWSLGEKEAAREAWLWSLDVDEWSAERAARLADLLEKDGKRNEAWILRARNARQFQRPVAELGPPPVLGSLPALKNLLALLAAHADQGLAADHNRLAELLGMPTVPAPREESQGAARATLDPAPRWLGLHGWTEDGLTGYEERRVEGLWYDAGDGDLHVGRKRPREGTGTLDRQAHQRHAYVRTREWMAPGRYVVEARIHATTSFISGALILGSTRRDRNVRVGFSAGDFLYAIGVKEEAAKLKNVGVSVHGLRERDGPLRGSTRSGGHPFEQEKSWFTLTALVDGPTVTVQVDGEWFATYHTVDGAPVEGHVGFAMGQGAVRVQSPTVQRLDRSGQARAAGPLPLPLRLDEPAVLAHASLQNHTFPGLPDAAAGFLVLWVPAPMTRDAASQEAERAGAARYARQSLDHILSDLEEEGLPQQVVVAIPTVLAPYLEGAISAADGAARGYHTLEHQWSYGDPDTGEVVDDQPRLLFVDTSHVARAIAVYIPGGIGNVPAFDRWLKVFSAGAAGAR